MKLLKLIDDERFAWGLVGLGVGLCIGLVLGVLWSAEAIRAL